MLVLNYAHPLTPEQRGQIAERLGGEPEVRDIPVQIDARAEFIAQVVALADAAGLSPTEWQQVRPLVINPPGLAPVAVALLAEIHGRRGEFPRLLCILRVGDGFEVVDMPHLQDVRDRARVRRHPAE